jgi:hypothetical protein
LFRDTVLTVLVAEWDTVTEMFDGGVARGPVPLFFASNSTVVLLIENFEMVFLKYVKIMYS